VIPLSSNTDESLVSLATYLKKQSNQAMPSDSVL
jgi:hypothetical protein